MTRTLSTVALAFIAFLAIAATSFSSGYDSGTRECVKEAK